MPGLYTYSCIIHLNGKAALTIVMQAGSLLDIGRIANWSTDDRGLGSAKTFCTSIRSVAAVCSKLCSH